MANHHFGPLTIAIQSAEYVEYQRHMHMVMSLTHVRLKPLCLKRRGARIV